MAPKRKAAAGTSNGNGPSSAPKSDPSKKRKTGATGKQHQDSSLINKDFYPFAEISDARARKYNSGDIPRPYDLLEDKISDTQKERDGIKPGKAVLHWYKRDLRLSDNRGLAAAAKLAKDSQVPLICLYIVSPEDYEAHFTGPPRVDFDLRTLEIMKKDLGKLDIPLVVETVSKRDQIIGWIMDFCHKHSIKNVFCNIEYEVDELRRELKLIDHALGKGIAFNPIHDDVVVSPGKLMTGASKQYAVYTPWYRAWVKYLHSHPDLLEECPKPGKNPGNARKDFKSLFDGSIPDAPSNKSLTTEEKQRFREIWPAGEHEARDRLEKFMKEMITQYSETRNIPSDNGVSMLSIHHSAGTLAARTSIREARNANSSKSLDGGKGGISNWISEVAWRDFYKHVMAHWPYVCMYKPFKIEYSNMEWEYNDDHFKAWCEGQTGFPIVDAAMRQMKEMAYMHNRCRMIVASFLAKDLLLDWRLGEKHFMLSLVDGDFASNNGGWGFSASVGVDPQPYFRIFNPLLQSEKFDPDGEYIREWVPELKNIMGKAIHDPYGRGEEKAAEKAGYPRPIIVHSERRDEALGRYKACSGH